MAIFLGGEFAVDTINKDILLTGRSARGVGDNPNRRSETI
jgi:hypothetical protein